MDRAEVERKIVEALRKVHDPEIPVNVYDLGLVYKIDIDVENKKVHVDMTITSIGCPVAYAIIDDAEAAIKEALGEDWEVNVELVMEPPWTPAKITEEGRKMLEELYGYDIVGEWIKQMS